MKYLITTLLLLLPAFVQAQDAVVVQLTSEEAAQARALHAEMEEADKAWKNYQEHITKKYTMTPGKDCLFVFNGQADKNCAEVKPEWKNATIEFTKDFRFIVPLRLSTLNPPCVGGQFGGYCWTTVSPAGSWIQGENGNTVEPRLYNLPMGYQTDQQ